MCSLEKFSQRFSKLHGMCPYDHLLCVSFILRMQLSSVRALCHTDFLSIPGLALLSF